MSVNLYADPKQTRDGKQLSPTAKYYVRISTKKIMYIVKLSSMEKVDGASFYTSRIDQSKILPRASHPGVIIASLPSGIW